jgi:hypothetical protein
MCWIHNTRLYDCAGETIQEVSSPVKDVFCCGHSLLANGGLLIAGGTSVFDYDSDDDDAADENHNDEGGKGWKGCARRTSGSPAWASGTPPR